MTDLNPPRQRLASLDQFRGYTVAGMFLVNFIGYFAVAPFLCKHHLTFNSYADTIMPQFFFAVGFSFRLSFGRRVHEQGTAKAYLHMIRRLLGLALVSFVVYRVAHRADPWQWDVLVEKGPIEALYQPFKEDWFQTLLHIAVTSLWILPVIRAGAMIRILYMIASVLLHIGLSYWFYFDWIHTPPTAIDGGPLGFLTWTIPTMVGTLACDVVIGAEERPPLVKMIAWAFVLMGLGYGMSCFTRIYDVPSDQVEALSDVREAENPVIPSREQFARWKENLTAGNWSEVLAEPPFVPPPHSREVINGNVTNESYKFRKWNYWQMGQCIGATSYQTFSAGFSLAVYVLFYILADMLNIRIGIFRTLGVNALVGYVLHDMVGGSVKAFMPPDSPAWYMWAGFALYFWITWLFLRSLEKQNIYIKL